MVSDYEVCLCGHLHETTRGWCNGRDCRCQRFVPRDPIELIAKRRRDLLAETDVHLEKTRGYRVRKPAVVEDVEWLLSAGETPEVIAQRIGMQVQSVLRAMRRHGRHDLADRLIGSRNSA